jgi:aminoglycoside 6'-N-acetyltransferase I
MRAILAGKPESTLPLVLFVAERQGRVIGFIEVGLRSHADGCDGARPVGFIEGWFVAPAHRGRGVGHALMDAAEAWTREQGCVEIASDTWADNVASERAHTALGFEVVDRCVNFRKALAPPPARRRR